MEDKEIRKRHTGSADGSRYDVVVESPQHHEALSSSTSERRLFESDEDVTTHSKIELSLSEPIPTEKPFKQYMLALLTLAIGNGLEWYDFAVYSGLNSLLGPLFFPSSSAELQALSFWGVFAIGFITRPLGAVIFGHIADVRSKKTALVSSILTMAIATTAIGCLPTYAMSGPVAPALLALFRATQGLAAGGEYGTAVMYLADIFPKKHQAMGSASILVASGVGLVMANVVLILIVGNLNNDQLRQWGWRVPFLIGAFTAFVGVLLRLRPLEELEPNQGHKGSSSPPSDEAAQKLEGDETPSHGKLLASPVISKWFDRFPFLLIIRGHWHKVLILACVEFFGASCYYAYNSWWPAYFRTSTIPKAYSLLTVQSMTVTTLLPAGFTMLVTGYLHDKGMRCLTTITVLGVLGPGVTAIAVQVVLNGGTLSQNWGLLALQMAIFGPLSATQPVIGYSLFPPEVRNTGYNLAYSISTVLGGLTPLAITAIQTSPRLASLKAGGGLYAIAIWIASTASGAIIACTVLRWMCPQCDYTVANWERKMKAKQIPQDPELALVGGTSKCPLVAENHQS